MQRVLEGILGRSDPIRLGYHPSVMVLYGILALVVICSCMEPWLLIVSVLSLFLVGAALKGTRAVLRGLAWKIPIVLFFSLLNGVFAHRGVTVLLSAGPLSLDAEGLLYGACMGMMLVAMMELLSSLGCAVDGDEALDAFGGRMPTLALMMTMVLRLVPQFIERGEATREAMRACTASPLHDGARTPGSSEKVAEEGFRERHRDHGKAVTALMAWSMEDAIVRAGSMRARGWGSTENRTFYERSRFRARDVRAMAIIAVLGIAAIVAVQVASTSFVFYPLVSQGAPLPVVVVCSAACAAFLLLPLFPIIASTEEPL